MKTYDIELQRLKSVRHDKGLIELGVDVLVQPRTARDDQGVTSYPEFDTKCCKWLI